MNLFYQWVVIIWTIILVKLIINNQLLCIQELFQMELRICDLRNAKYQGETFNKQPAGFGFVLDQLYTFVIGQFFMENSRFQGPIAVVFGNSHKLCLEDFNNKAAISLYSTPQFKIYANASSLVVDCLIPKILLKIEPQSIKKQSQEQNPQQKQQTSLKIIKQKAYTSQNYLRILQQFLQIPRFQSKNLSYQNFIKQNFKSKHKNLINVLQSSKQFAFGFKNQGLFIKLAKKPEVILNMGFMGTQKRPEISRKYSYFRDYNNCIVQESIETEISTCIQFEQTDKSNTQILNPSQLPIHTLEDIRTSSQANPNHMNSIHPNEYYPTRPKECIKNLRQYLKRSLTFINRYLNMSSIYDKKEYFEQVIKRINLINNGQYAQVQLENNGYRLDQNNNPIIPAGKSIIKQQATVEDWKKELDKTIANRGRSRRKSKQQTFINSNSRITKNRNSPEKQTIYTSPKNQQILSTPYKKISSEAPQSSYLESQKKNLQHRRGYGIKQKQKQKQKENQRNQRSKSQRQIKYLDSQSDDPVGQQQINNLDRIKYSIRNPERTQQKASKYSDYNHLNSTNQNSQFNNSNRRSPIPYKFKYTQIQQIQNKIQKFPVGSSSNSNLNLNLSTAYKGTYNSPSKTNGNYGGNFNRGNDMSSSKRQQDQGKSVRPNRRNYIY